MTPEEYFKEITGEDVTGNPEPLYIVTASGMHNIRRLEKRLYEGAVDADHARDYANWLKQWWPAHVIGRYEGQAVLSPEELTRHLEAATYKFAKTMPEIPHWYTLRNTWQDQKMFAAVVQALRDLGEIRPWPPQRPKYYHTYFDTGEWSYWTMGAPVCETILINRAKRDK